MRIELDTKDFMFMNITEKEVQVILLFLLKYEHAKELRMRIEQTYRIKKKGWL